MVHYAGKPVPIEDHGFDPISLELANSLIKGFKDLNREGLDSSFNEIFLNADVVDSLLTYKRIAVSDFDGYKFRFGIDADRKIVLILHREKGEIIGRDEKYTKVRDYYSVYDQEKDKFYRIEMSRILSDDVLVPLKLIPNLSKEYGDFQDNFDQQLEISKDLAAIFISEGRGGEGDRPPVPPAYYSVVGYFIGLGILRKIRPYETGKGLKIFFGYGPSRDNSRFNNFHLIMIQAESAEEDIVNNREEIWATYDISKIPEVYKIANNQGILPPINGVSYLTSGGSSCVRPEEQTKEVDG